MTHLRSTTIFRIFGFILAVLFSAAGLTSFAQFKDYPQAPARVEKFATTRVPSWVSVDAYLRTRSEGQTSMAYASGSDHGYQLTRAWVGFEVRPTKWINGYAQFMDSHALVLPLPNTAANMRDNFDVRQAYLRLHAEKASLAAGRMELKFGGERLIGISDWTNVSRTFDGFTARIGASNRVDLFSASVVKVTPTSFDRHSAGLNFHGAYFTLPALVPHTTFEPYFLIKALPSVKSQQGVPGTETETTEGMRVLGATRYGLEYVAEGALQRGSFSNNSIHSGAGYAKLGYTAKRLRWSPRVQVEYDYATGNSHRNAARISTFDQLYPSAHNVFGLTDLVGWQNIQQERVHLDLAPGRRLTVLLQQGFLQAANRHDGLYSGSASQFLKPPAAGFAAHSIGGEFDASARYVLGKDYTLNAGVGHFSPGPVMTANAHDTPITIAYFAVTYRFTLNNKP